ncbi:MAG: hypothetical protein V7676_00675 [Parasphingorhabdus sp.]|uniref:hypothetical protein n=1 Tax=Parasphingorhabdus sp. TaxID=2709688 RepID=UPI00300215E2
MFLRLSIFSAAIFILGQVAIAQTLPDQVTKENGVSEIAPPSKATAPAENIPYDLTGYWKYGDNRILYLTQNGVNLESRHTKRTTDFVHEADEVDFTATLRGNLVYGAHLIRLSWAMHNICPVDLWVGMGLTVNDEQTKLTGFRGHRTVNLKTCKVEDQPPRDFVYTRMLDEKGHPLK